MKESAEHMRRSSAVITSILGAASLLLAVSVGITYKNVFYMSDERKSRRWKLPRGEQFEKDYDRMNELIAAAEALLDLCRGLDGRANRDLRNYTEMIRKLIAKIEK